jgi:hypothetical protein
LREIEAVNTKLAKEHRDMELRWADTKAQLAELDGEKNAFEVGPVSTWDSPRCVVKMRVLLLQAEARLLRKVASTLKKKLEHTDSGLSDVEFDNFLVMRTFEEL